MRMYKVEYADGEKSALSANLTAESMFAHIEKAGNRHVLMDKITDHWFDQAAVNSQDVFVTTSSGTKFRIQTTQGFSLFVKCHNGNTTWVALNYIKQAYPVQLAQYALADNISIETAFAWWVPHILKKRNCIIEKVKYKYWLKNHKFGIKVPKNKKQAIEYDRESGNKLCWDSVCQDMKNVHP